MKVLALDSSGLVASVAVLNGDKIICEYTTNYKQTHSVTLMPMVDEVCKAVDLNLKELDLIAVSSGPGSFTGIRIGSATAKGLAHALKIPIAAIPTLEVLANNISYTNCIICPLMDARRQQVYTALYKYEKELIVPITEMMAIEVDDLITILLKQEQEVIFVGDGYLPNKEAIDKGLADRVFHVAPRQHQLQRASCVATLAIAAAKNNKLEDYLNHEPIYLRKSQAEREYDEKISKK